MIVTRHCFLNQKRILRELLQRQRHQERFQVSMKKWSIKSYINIQFHFFYETGERTIEDILKEKQISIFDGKTYEPDLGQ